MQDANEPQAKPPSLAAFDGFAGARYAVHLGQRVSVRLPIDGCHDDIHSGRVCALTTNDEYGRVMVDVVLDVPIKYPAIPGNPDVPGDTGIRAYEQWQLFVPLTEVYPLPDDHVYVNVQHLHTVLTVAAQGQYTCKGQDGQLAFGAFLHALAACAMASGLDLSSIALPTVDAEADASAEVQS